MTIDEIMLDQTLRDSAKRFARVLSSFASTNFRTGEVYTKQLITKTSQQYLYRYLERYTLVNLLGIKQSSHLLSSYVLQHFQLNQSIRSFGSIEELEEAFMQDQQRDLHFRKDAQILGMELVNKEPYLMVLGAPALGKSTFLRYVGLEAWQEENRRYQHDLIPVFLELRKLPRDKLDLMGAIAEEFHAAGLPYASELTVWLLKQGKLLILLDGLNEAPFSQSAISQSIQNLAQEYSQNRYVASCRIDSHQKSLGHFLEVLLQPWDDLHMQEYVHKWFAIAHPNIHFPGNESPEQKLISWPSERAAKEAHRCWQILQLHASAKQLAATPMFLSLLCLLSDRRASLPNSVSTLYRKVVHILLEEQVLNYQLRNTANGYLSSELLEIICAKLAYLSFERNRSFFSFSEITELIHDPFAENGSYSEFIEVKAVTDILCKLHLCQVVLTNFFFHHITLQEYLAAEHVGNSSKIEEIVNKHLSDRRWKYIFLLLAGLLFGGTDKLLTCIEQRTNSYIETPRLRALLNWLEQISIHSIGEFKLVAKRMTGMLLARPRFLELAPALALIRILSIVSELCVSLGLSLELDQVFELELSLTLAHALDLDSETELNLAINLSSALEQALAKIDFDRKQINFAKLKADLSALQSQVPDYEQPFEVRHAFRMQIVLVWLRTLRLPLELNHISQDEIVFLENYFYANLLMVQCKQAAIVVSPQVWEAIETRMIT